MSALARLNLKLRHLSVASFRKSERTNLDELIAESKLAMTTHDAAAFVSKRGDQVLLVRVKSVKWHDGKLHRAYHSQRFRCPGATWTPADLFQAAREFGVDLSWLHAKFVRYFDEIEGG